MAMKALLVALLSAIALAACGNITTTPSGTLEPSAEPTASQVAGVSESPAIASFPPIPDPSSGVGSPPPIASGAGAAFEVCSLLKADELAQIFGVEGVRTRPMPSSGWVSGRCAWNGPSSGFFVSVGTAASFAAGRPAVQDAKAKLAQFKQQASAPKDVAGIGDGAVLSAIGIAAYRGDAYLEVTNLGLTDDQLIEIARIVIARL